MEKITRKFGRKSRIVLAGCLVAALLTGSVFTLSASAQRPGAIPQQKEYAFEVPALSGGDSMLLQQNPGRGLRMEVYMNVKTGRGVFKAGENRDAIEILEEMIAKYDDDQPRLAQVYFYLTDYKNSRIDEEGFRHMEEYFKVLKEHNIKAVLRFAYIWDGDASWSSQDKSANGKIQDIQDLAPFIEAHKDQIHVLQAGMFGAWGEWGDVYGGGVNKNDVKRVMAAYMENIPEELQMQVRLWRYKTDYFDHNADYYDRISFHDDYLIGDYDDSNNLGSKQPISNVTEEEKAMISEACKTLNVDGEMIWGRANQSLVGSDTIDAIKVAKRLRDDHFTSMSLEHNYKESDDNSIASGVPNEYAIVHWQSEFINRNVLDREGLLYQEEWFKDKNGNNISRNMFEYIRDYLGYYLVAENASAKTDGGKVDVSLTLNNYGFAAPVGLSSIKVVLLDADDQVIEEKEACDLLALQTNEPQDIRVSFTRPDSGRAYTVAIAAQDSAGTPVRLANDVEFRGGFNILGELT